MDFPYENVSLSILNKNIKPFLTILAADTMTSTITKVVIMYSCTPTPYSACHVGIKKYVGPTGFHTTLRMIKLYVYEFLYNPIEIQLVYITLLHASEACKLTDLYSQINLACSHYIYDTYHVKWC